MEKISKSEADWREQLTPIQFTVTRHKGTERAFTGEYWDEHRGGVYFCVCCDAELFTSDVKFDSGCGWPSFFAPAEGALIETATDTTYGMKRTEITCATCDSHLGHVFDDGPPPTGLRFCVNSASLRFVPDGE